MLMFNPVFLPLKESAALLACDHLRQADFLSDCRAVLPDMVTSDEPLFYINQ